MFRREIYHLFSNFAGVYNKYNIIQFKLLNGWFLKAVNLFVYEIVCM